MVLRGTSAGMGVAFSFPRVEEEARALIQKAQADARLLKEEAETFLARTREEVQELRSKAESEGRQAGLEAGRQQVYREMVDRLETEINGIRVALQGLTGSLEHQKGLLLEQGMERLWDLVLAIASRVLQRRIEEEPILLEDRLRGLLSARLWDGTLSVRLHPADWKLLQERWPVLEAAASGVEGIQWVSDESIPSRGGCWLETERGCADGTLEGALEEIGRRLKEGLK
jgi:flagellar assembly protein FliH